MTAAAGAAVTSPPDDVRLHGGGGNMCTYCVGVGARNGSGCIFIITLVERALGGR
jgi:hypothetical protein